MAVEACLGAKRGSAAVRRAPSIAAAPPHAETLACGAGWQVVPTRNSGDRVNSLNGVLALGPNDVWAVGDRFARRKGVRTLTEHWDGEAWSIVRSPNMRGGASGLSDISGSAADDVWAVGAAEGQPLTEHWDGRAWTLVAAPGPGVLEGVVALGPSFALAVGYRSGKHETKPFALRWTGTAWEQIPAQGRGDPDPEAFESVAATRRSNAWAVGTATASEPAPRWRSTGTERRSPPWRLPLREPGPTS
jgi:hypothetical protein